MLQAFQKGIDQKNMVLRFFQTVGGNFSGAKYTLRIMEQAPVTIFVFNTLGTISLRNFPRKNEYSRYVTINRLVLPFRISYWRQPQKRLAAYGFVIFILPIKNYVIGSI